MISSEKSQSIRLLKYREKLKSSYFSQEKLLEFYKKELPTEDMSIIESDLSNSLTLRQELDDLIEGQKFVQSLKGIELTEMMKAKVQQAQPQPLAINISQRLDLSQWSAGVRRSSMIVAGALAVVIVMLMVPWSDIYDQIMQKQTSQIVLIETSRVKSDLDLSTYEQQEKPEFSDEKDVEPVVESKTPETTVAVNTAPTPTPAPTTPTPAPTQATPPPPAAKDVPVAKNDQPVVKPAPAPQPGVKTPPVQPAPAPTPEVAATTAASPTVGYLYRGHFSISNLQDTEPKITEKIKELGGRKAGDVALGWKKTPQLAYYHFTIPENKLNELTQFLSLYGQPGIVKEKHPRVMPEGIIRLIIEIEEAKP